MLEAVAQKLAQNGFDTRLVQTGDEAKALVLALIPLDATVGVGGSVTVRDLDLPTALRARGQTVFDHWQEGLDAAGRRDAALRQLRADVFLASSNAVTLNGELVNIDNTGNRVAAMLFGPGRVVLIVGRNKIVPDVPAAVQRIKNTVAPRNTRRRGDKTPCALDGRCHDCNSPDRLCRAVTVLEKKTKGIPDFTVILVNADLGY